MAALSALWRWFVLYLGLAGLCTSSLAGLAFGVFLWWRGVRTALQKQAAGLGAGVDEDANLEDDWYLPGQLS